MTSGPAPAGERAERAAKPEPRHARRALRPTHGRMTAAAAVPDQIVQVGDGVISGDATSAGVFGQ